MNLVGFCTDEVFELQGVTVTLLSLAQVLPLELEMAGMAHSSAPSAAVAVCKIGGAAVAASFCLACL